MSAPAAACYDLEPFHVEAQGHRFVFYPCGRDRLQALLELIQGAERSLQVFYYLFESDAAGTKVRDALVAAARRGVDVELIVDDFGNDAGAAFFTPLTEAGGSFAIFSPKWGMRYLVRNHQKFVIADGCRVMTGGANVADSYFASPGDNGWCDLALSIEGDVTSHFTRWFGLVREWVANASMGRTRRLRRLRDIVQQWDGGDGSVRLLVSGPLVRHGHWARFLRKDLIAARRLDTVSAYFSPPRSFRRLMRRVGQRGDARMIMAGQSDIGATIDSARLLYGPLLSAGVRVFEFSACKLHMKLLVVGDVCYFGSANLDKRSFRINVELMVRVEDAALAAQIREFIDHIEASSEPITREWYAREGTFLNKLRWRLAYWLSLSDYRISRVGTR